MFDKPTVVTTVLGSCVSVSLFCRTKNIGAIFHALLPIMPDKEKNKPLAKHYRYVDTSIRHIIYSFRRRGIKQNQIEAKVFGGAQGVFKGTIRPGSNNIMTAYEVLAAHNIKIVASDVGGERGRNLIFVSSSGEVFVKNHLYNMKDTVLRKNKTNHLEYPQKAAKQPKHQAI